MASVNMAVIDVCQREIGQLSNRKFADRLAASKDLVLRLDILKQLKTKGFAYTVSFNPDGNILVSGSCIGRIVLQDWETGFDKHTFESGHGRIDRILQAKIMPDSNDRSLITCADDGQVRHAQILDGGVETRLLSKHEGGAYKLAVEPGNRNTFYTCGEDGVVKHIDLRTAAAAKDLFKCHPIDGSRADTVIPLCAIAIDPRNPDLFAVAGSDKYTRLYDIRQYKRDGSTDFGKPVDYFCPPRLIGDHQVGVTCLAFSSQSELLVSYSDGSIYLFTSDMGLVGQNPVPSTSSSSATQAEGKAIPQVYNGHVNKETAKCVSFFGPKSEYVVSGSCYGRMFIWKKKGGELVRVMKGDVHLVKCIESHPQDDATVLASCGYEDIKIWSPKTIDDNAMLPTNYEEVSDCSGHRIFNVGPICYFSFPGCDEDLYVAGGMLCSSSSEDEEYGDDAAAT